MYTTVLSIISHMLHSRIAIEAVLSNNYNINRVEKTKDAKSISDSYMVAPPLQGAVANSSRKQSTFLPGLLVLNLLYKTYTSLNHASSVPISLRMVYAIRYSNSEQCLHKHLEQLRNTCPWMLLQWTISLLSLSRIKHTLQSVPKHASTCCFSKGLS